jgi:hypothetical protein
VKVKGLAEIAAKMVRDQQAFIDATTKLARPSADLRDLRPEIPDIPAVREVTPLAEQIADLIKPKPQRETRGRKAKWDWERAALGVYGRVYRGNVPEPKSLAEVEALLSEWFVANSDGEQPVTSQIREHARPIWREIREGEN